jgi:16S rRNA (cytosine967-C5)-methyltransferase
MRRRPEIRWRLAESDLVALAALQARLLEAAADHVAPGGALVYSVCSLEPEEGEEVIEALLARRRDVHRVPEHASFPAEARELLGADGALRTSPANGGLDGFYATILRRE